MIYDVSWGGSIAVGTVGTGFPTGNGFRDGSYGGGDKIAIDDLLLV